MKYYITNLISINMSAGSNQCAPQRVWSKCNKWPHWCLSSWNGSQETPQIFKLQL